MYVFLREFSILLLNCSLEDSCNSSLDKSSPIFAFLKGHSIKQLHQVTSPAITKDDNLDLVARPILPSIPFFDTD
jgi:hypothetical protein